MVDQAHEVATVDGVGGSPIERRSPIRRIDVSDLRLDRVRTLAFEHPPEWSEVFFERRGARSFLVGRK